MGKVVKAVAGIAIVAGIAYFAPYLAPQLLGVLGTQTATAIAISFTSAVIGTAMGIGASLAMSALAKRPGTLPPGQALTKSLPIMQTSNFRMVQEDFPPDIGDRLPPVDPNAWRRPFSFFNGRYAISGTRGDCMVPEMAKGAYIVVDRIAPIAPGDLFVFAPDDLHAGHYMMGLSWWSRWRVSGLVKRYDGRDVDSRTVYFHCVFPKMQRLATGQDRLTYAYRIVSSHGSWWQAWKACRQLRAATRQRQ